MDVQKGYALIDFNFPGKLDTVVDAVEDVVEGFGRVLVVITTSFPLFVSLSLVNSQFGF